MTHLFSNMELNPEAQADDGRTPMELMIEKAKLRVIKSYERNGTTTRAWLEMHVDSYENPGQRLQVFVLEGSPVKGMVVANYGFDSVSAFSCWGQRLKTYSVYDVVRK